MAFNAHLIEARLALVKIGPDEMPPLAWDVLEAGLDGPAIRRMAALVNPSGWQTDQVIPSFMKEAGLERISIERASMRLAQDLARRILSEGLDPLEHSRQFEWLCIEAGYPRVLQDVGSLDDEKYLASSFGNGKEELRDRAREMLVALIRIEELDGPSSTE